MIVGILKSQLKLALILDIETTEQAKTESSDVLSPRISILNPIPIDMSLSPKQESISTVAFSDDNHLISDKSHGETTTPPDGGLTAWLQVLGSYFLFFNTWGLINAFGVFQTYYKTRLFPTESNSSIAWIGTVASFILCASPITWGFVFDMGSPRLLLFAGSVSLTFGIFMASVCRAYWQILLAQGICCGVGGGCLFITATSVLPSYFKAKRALALGIAASGSSLGGILYPILFMHLQPSIGFGWTVRVIGLIAGMTLCVACLVIKSRKTKQGPWTRSLAMAVVNDRPFIIFNLATFFGFVGQYIPYVFIEQYANEHGMRMAFYMLIFLNLGSIPGRILPSLVADKFLHPLKVLTATTACASILALVWISVRHSTPGLISWCMLYGFCSGAFVSLQGAVVASITTDLSMIGTRFGVNIFCGALGILIGSPVGGAIFPISWPGAQSFCGITLALSTLTMAFTLVNLREK